MERKILFEMRTRASVDVSPVLHGPFNRRDPNLDAVICDPVHRVDRRYFQVYILLIRQQTRHDFRLYVAKISSREPRTNGDQEVILA